MKPELSAVHIHRWHSRLKPASAVAIAVGAFAVLFVVLMLPLRPMGQALRGPWVVHSLDGHAITQSRTPVVYPMEGLDTVRLETAVGPTGNDGLALIWPDATALRVFWNGELLAEYGDPHIPTANLWSTAFAVPLPDTAQRENRLVLEMTSPYGVQLLVPPYVAPEHAVVKRVAFHNLMYQHFLLASIGGGIAVGLLLIVFSNMQRSDPLPGIFLGVAAVAVAIYGMDYGMRLSTGSLVLYRWMRVLFVSSGFLAALSFVMGLERYVYNRLRLSFVMAVPTAVIIALVLASPSLAWLFRWLPLMNLVLLINLLVVLGILFTRPRQHTFFLIPGTIVALAILELVGVMILNRPWPPMIQFTALFAAILFSIQILKDYTEVYRHKERLQAAYNKDALTGVYNRHVLNEIHFGAFDVVIVTDLDNFKVYNDANGHAAGDEVLRLFAQVLTENLRNDDMVIRFGGDEFVIFLMRASEEDGSKIMERVRSRFRELCNVPVIDVSYGIQTADATLRDRFEAADRAMYAMKAAHKQAAYGFEV